jgi:hypothetical protein
LTYHFCASRVHPCFVFWFADDRPLFEEALYDWRRVMDAWLFPHGEFWETK